MHITGEKINGKRLIAMLLLIAVPLIVAGCSLEKQSSREIIDNDKSLVESVITEQPKELVTKQFTITGFT